MKYRISGQARPKGAIRWGHGSSRPWHLTQMAGLSRVQETQREDAYPSVLTGTVELFLPGKNRGKICAFCICVTWWPQFEKTAYLYAGFSSVVYPHTLTGVWETISGPLMVLDAMPMQIDHQKLPLNFTIMHGEWLTPTSFFGQLRFTHVVLCSSLFFFLVSYEHTTIDLSLLSILKLFQYK